MSPDEVVRDLDGLQLRWLRPRSLAEAGRYPELRGGAEVLRGRS